MTTIAESDARQVTLAAMNRTLEREPARLWTALDVTTGRQHAMQTAINPADVARYILALAGELADARGESLNAQTVQDMAEMVAVAGLPANGPGIFEAEWTEEQMALLDREYYGQVGAQAPAPTEDELAQEREADARSATIRARQAAQIEAVCPSCERTEGHDESCPAYGYEGGQS